MNLRSDFLTAATPELRFLTRCLAPLSGESGDVGGSPLCAEPLNVAEILWLAQRHAVAVRLYKALSNSPVHSVPTGLLKPLQRAARANAVRALRQLEALKRLGRALRMAGVETAAFASALLGIRLQQDPAWFCAREMDLLCPAGQIDRAVHLIHGEMGHGLRHTGHGALLVKRAGDAKDPVHLYAAGAGPADIIEYPKTGLEEGSVALCGAVVPDDALLFRFLAAKARYNRWNTLATIDKLAALWVRAPEVGMQLLEAEPAAPLLPATVLVRDLLGTPLPLPVRRLLDHHARSHRGELITALGALLGTRRGPVPAVPKMAHAPAESAKAPADLGEFASTPIELVEPLLALAEVGAEDTCVDLGCGDGRILIEAAKRRGCRCIGYDIDRRLVERASAATREAGVGERVRFVHEDVLHADLSEATVIISYLRTAGNLALLPRFHEALRPGTRIVTRDFHFGSWPPVQVDVRRIGPADVSFLYLWRW